MTREELEELKAQVNAFFDRYCNRYSGDALIPYCLKRDHTRRVRDHIRTLACSLGLCPTDVNRAEAAAWLHDTGRFPQFEQFQTFSDPLSKSHAALSLKVALHEKFLSCLARGERQLILRAVALHNRPWLPAGLEPELDTLARMLRDADKMDIFKVMTDHYTGPSGGSRSFITHSHTDDGRINPDLVAKLEAGRGFHYRFVKTLNDMKLFQLGMIYDLNYPAALAHVRARGVVGEFLGSMPEDPLLEQVKSALEGYMDSRINGREPEGREEYSRF